MEAPPCSLAAEIERYQLTRARRGNAVDCALGQRGAIHEHIFTSLHCPGEHIDLNPLVEVGEKALPCGHGGPGGHLREHAVYGAVPRVQP